MAKASPFKPINEPEGRWRRLTDLLDRRPRKRAEEIEGKARALLEWAQMPYFSMFMEYLQKESDRMVDTSNQAKLIADTARCNTFKEIRRHLTSDIEHAKKALGEN